MKKIVALFLTITLVICLFPVTAYAAKEKFVNIVIEHNGINKQFSVIESGEDLLFSGEDLTTLGGFEYRIEENNAYFTRGIKTLRVDLKKSRLYPYADHLKVGAVDFVEKVQQIDGVYYFPGAEMLPWLNVKCNLIDGTLDVDTDDVSIWEVFPQFASDEFYFDFVECCEELGVNSKYLKARAYLQDEGFSDMFFDLIPVIGDDLDYYELFEDILQDKSSAEIETEDLLNRAENTSYWMDIAEDFDVSDDLPNEFQVFGEVANFLSNNSVSFSYELAMYIKSFYQHDKNVLCALHSMEENASLYGLPEAAVVALVDIRENYSDYYAGIEQKMMLAIGDTTLEGLTESASGLFKVATRLLGLAETTVPDWAEGINRISSYDVIAKYCLDTYQEITDYTWLSSIRDLRSLAYMYLYACEQNWMAMSEYAAEQGKTDLAEKYKEIAESAEEWQIKFMKTSSAEVNDSHEYGDATGGMKQAYTDKLKAIFSNLNRSAVVEPIIIELTWDGTYDDGELMQLYPNLSGTYDDGVTLNLYADCAVLVTSDGDKYSFKHEPVYYNDILIATVDYDNVENGKATVYLYRYDGVFNFRVEDAGYGDHMFDSHIQASGAKVAVQIPYNGDTVIYDLNSGVYRSYTGCWFWGPFALDHGGLSEYDASWIGGDTSTEPFITNQKMVNIQHNRLELIYLSIMVNYT